MRRLLLWAIVASLLVSAVVTTVSLLQKPKYEASAVRLVDAQVKSDGRPHPIPTTTFGTLEHVARKTAVASGSRPVAAETIRRLGLEMSPDKLLDNQKGATPHHSGKPQALEERAPRTGGNIVALDSADSGACVLEGKLSAYLRGS